MRQRIAEMLNEYEPRIFLNKIVCRPDEEKNSYFASITFTIIGTQEPVVVETFLERVR